ncbi:hypothetical protein [Nonomuraea soli]|uniref:Uncharacterized protein n=1 Tax=Nonomuraea soli TaxID=1032476 RepID=A0A7W0CQ83_9ACTN|nr:hypothetical protein [Nonomuraea soli]MBA2895339.1 hypothetical protein [Nonomuraea soli]
MRIRLPAALVLLLSSIFLVTGVRAPVTVVQSAAVLDCPAQHQAGSPAPVTPRVSAPSHGHASGLAVPSVTPAASAGGRFLAGTAEATDFTPGASPRGVSARAPPATHEI